jgi:D-threo-aldose 1-dehydrogenase
MSAKVREKLALPRMGFGGGSLHPVTREREAADLLNAAWDRGFRYFDTAPFYATGLAEHWFGAALRTHPRDEFALSTKVGRILRPKCETPVPADRLPFEYHYDYTREGTLRSIDDSLQRLGICRIDLAFIHDVNPRWQGSHYELRFAEAMSGAYPTLDRLRAEGVVRAIGVGVKGADICLRFATAGRFDYFMLAGGYTLLEHEVALDGLLPHCEQHGIGVVVASPFNSGILALGAVSGATFFYAEAPPEIVERVRRLQTVCDRHRVPIGAAALQFTLAHPAIVSAVCGYRSVVEVETNLRWVDWRIPSALWDELKHERLIPSHAPVPASGE